MTRTGIIASVATKDQRPNEENAPGLRLLPHPAARFGPADMTSCPAMLRSRTRTHWSARQLTGSLREFARGCRSGGRRSASGAEEAMAISVYPAEVTTTRDVRRHEDEAATRVVLRVVLQRSLRLRSASARLSATQVREHGKARRSGPFLISGSGWIRTNVDIRQRVYSPSPLASRAHSQRRAAALERPRAEVLANARRAQPIVPRRLWASGSVSSFLSVLFSIWRMRSRVTPKARPTSSSVRGRSPVRP